MSYFDLFICCESFKSPDCTDFAEPLREALRRANHEIGGGRCISAERHGSVRVAILNGIHNCTAGLLIISPRFLSRAWPPSDLAALASLQTIGKNRVFPVWLDVDYEAVRRLSPQLADQKAFIATPDLDELAKQIVDTIPSERLTDEEVDSAIACRMTADRDEIRYITHVSLANLSQFVALNNGYEKFILKTESLPEQTRHTMEDAWRAEAYHRLKFPRGSYTDSCGGIGVLSAGEVRWAATSLQKWCKGTLGAAASVYLMLYLDEHIDVDYTHILFDIPNFLRNGPQSDRLDRAIPRIGSRRVEAPESLLSYGDYFNQAWEKYCKALAGSAT